VNDLPTHSNIFHARFEKGGGVCHKGVTGEEERASEELGAVLRGVGLKDGVRDWMGISRNKRELVLISIGGCIDAVVE
jgi:hypothetical protein